MNRIDNGKHVRWNGGRIEHDDSQCHLSIHKSSNIDLRRRNQTHHRLLIGSRSFQHSRKPGRRHLESLNHQNHVFNIILFSKSDLSCIIRNVSATCCYLPFHKRAKEEILPSIDPNSCYPRASYLPPRALHLASSIVSWHRQYKHTVPNSPGSITRMWLWKFRWTCGAHCTLNLLHKRTIWASSATWSSRQTSSFHINNFRSVAGVCNAETCIHCGAVLSHWHKYFT